MMSKSSKSLWQILCVFLLIAQAEARPYFNDLKAPQTLEDLAKIQKSLQDSLPKTRAATVCLQIGEGSGTGVIVSPEGLVLTAAHVSGGVDQEVTALMEDGTEVKGVTLGLNSETDAAMVQLQGDGPFPFVEMDRDDSTKLGDWVFALGYSGGFDQARGVVVRLGRLVRMAESTVQSDCLLIGGDSGGPLFNIEGLLIGIHSRVGKVKEESMHVPLREFLSRWDELKKSEFIGEGPFAQKPVKGAGFLGLGSADSSEGLRVNKVMENGTAAKIGLQVDDILLVINDTEIKTKEDLQKALAEMVAGKRLKLKWQRGDEKMEGEGRLGTRP